MTALKKYNLEGKETGKVSVDKQLSESTVHSQMVKDYIVALRANARQWSASTKGRSEVKHTTAKPHRQKGTGRARQGSLVSPQFRGGGIVFGPKPKFDQHVRINRREKKAVIRALLAEKILNNNLIILEDTKIEQPKTKLVAGFLGTLGMTKRVLFIGESNTSEIDVEGSKQLVSVKCEKHQNFSKSIRNLPKTQFALAKNINGYDLLLAKNLVVTEAAFKELNEWLS